jgi:hypothetical protein
MQVAEIFERKFIAQKPLPRISIMATTSDRKILAVDTFKSEDVYKEEEEEEAVEVWDKKETDVEVAKGIALDATTEVHQKNNHVRENLCLQKTTHQLASPNAYR